MEKENRKNTPSHNNLEGEHFREISKSKNESKAYGFENEVLSLERMLLKGGDDRQLRAIGIVGMAGVGKTTLSQEIFNKKEVKDHFVPRIWVCLSRQQKEDENSKVEIVKRMLERLGVEGEILKSIREKYELTGLLYALHQQLIGKRYLIVLDDFDEDMESWCKNLHTYSSQGRKWGEHLCDGLPKGCGGTVIVTSRNEELAKEMIGEENLHHLQPLSDPKSCWSIYQEAAGPRFINPEPLQELQGKLKKKCGGLPLAAKLMGQIKAGQLAEATTDTYCNSTAFI